MARSNYIYHIYDLDDLLLWVGTVKYEGRKWLEASTYTEAETYMVRIPDGGTGGNTINPVRLEWDTPPNSA